MRLLHRLALFAALASLVAGCRGEPETAKYASKATVLGGIKSNKEPTVTVETSDGSPKVATATEMKSERPAADVDGDTAPAPALPATESGIAATTPTGTLTGTTLVGAGPIPAGTTLTGATLVGAGPVPTGTGFAGGSSISGVGISGSLTGGIGGVGGIGGGMGSPKPGWEGKAPAPPAVAAGVADPVAGMARPAPKKQVAPLPAGILTAGSFDDNVDPAVFQTFAGKMAQHQGLGDLPGKLRGQRLVVLVKDAAGRPVGDAKIVLRAGAATSPELVTRTDGRAVFVLSWDQVPAGQAIVATVTVPGGSPVVETIPAGSARWDVTLASAQPRSPRQLDLAIVLDTTGSMGDELEYLKTEIRGIAAAINKKFPDVRQRYALVLYRDQGDVYVVRHFDFTDSLDEFHRNLSAQSAGGGGDYPEAVHRGLQQALQLRWRESDTARVLFLVGDAPPHAQFMGQALDAANALRKRGVALYPVACSGYDDACEFFMRSCALLTGGQFLFLTDDSKVGNAHGEPRIPYYQVERLNQLMTRVIESELSGRRIDPSPQDIIRTVGRKVN